MTTSAAETEVTLGRVTNALLGMSNEQVIATATSMGLTAAQTATAMAAKGMAAADIAAELATRGFSKATAEAALIQAGFTPEIAASAVAQYSFAAAEGTATVATNSFTASIAAATKGLWTFLTTTPVGWAILAAGAIFLVVKVFDALTESAEEATEKMDESFSEFEEARSKVDSLNDQLQSTSDRIDELNAKDSLTFVEQSELDKLKESAELLQIQADLAEKKRIREAKEAAEDTVNAYRKNFKHEISQSAIDDYISTSSSTGLFSDDSDIAAMLAGIEQMKKLRDELDKDDDWYEDDYEHFQGVIDDATDSIWEQIDVLSKYKSNLEAIPYDELTAEQKSALKEIDATIELVYKSLDPAKWNDIQFGKIVDGDEFTDDIDALNRLASESTVTADTISSQFPRLAQACREAGVDLDSLAEHFNALNEASKNTQLEIELKAVLADDQDALGNMVKDAAKYFEKNGKVDLYEVLDAGVAYENSPRKNNRRAELNEEETAYVHLKYAADQYGMTVEDLIRLLDELGYVEMASTEWHDIAEQSFDSLKESASNVISEISNVQSILNSQANGKSISLADFNAEEMMDYQSALEYVNGTMQLNADKCREIAKAKAEEQIAINETKKALTQADYLENAKQIEKYRQKLRDANFENGETAESIQASIDALLDENSALAANCKQYDLLSASIKEAMGSYQHWLNAQNSSDYGDMADDAVSAIERIRDTFDSNSDIFGNFGSKKFDAAVDFIVPDSVDSDDLSAIESYMNNFKQYLKFDSNGDPDGLNIDQFLKNSVEAGLMNYSEDEGWTIAGQKSMEDFAEGLNLSSGVVQAFFDELQLKGAEFDWADEAIKSFGDLAIEANEAAEALRLIDGNDGLKIKVDVSDLSTTNEQITALDTTITEMNTLKSKVNVDPSEIEYANTVIQYCIAQKQLLSQPEVMRVDTTQCSEDVANVISLLQQFQQAQNELEIVQSVGADTTNAKAKVDGLVAEIDALSPEVKTQLGLDTTSIDAIQESINELTADVMVTFGVNDEAIQGYNPETKQCEVIYDPNTDLLPESFDPLSRTVNYQANTKDLPTYFKPLTRTVRYVAAGDTQGGSHRVNGTAQASGTANAGGNWGTASGGKTLVGELGREIVVDPHTGRWYTVGDNGAEFVDIPDGAIVFNHKQTESLLENGYVTGRAAALASGTAMVTGGYKPYKPKVTTPTTKTTTNQIKDATKAAEDLEEQLKDTLDEMKKTMDNVLNYFNHEMFLMEKNNKVVVRIVPKIDDGEVKTSLNHITDFDDFTKNQMENASQIVAIYKQMQETVHNQAEEYRKLGLDENSSEIQELQKQWWEYSDEITNSVVSAYETITGELENAIGLTDVWLNKAISEHDYGGIVQYTQDTINYYHRMQEAIHEEAEFYRSKGYSDASDEVSSLSKLWWEYYEEIKNATANAWQQVVDNVNDAVDEITGLYDTLKDAAQEYADSGFITIDTLQEICSWGVQYLAYLKDENGQLVINEESLQKVIAARTEQMAVETALSYVQQIRSAIERNEITELMNLTLATEQTTTATWDLVYAQLRLLNVSGDLNDTMYAGALQNINNLRALSGIAISSIGKVEGSVKEANESAKKALKEQGDYLDDLLKYVMEMIKQEVKNQIEALENQVDKMKDIVDLQKKSLELEREKDNYTKNVAEKTKELAKLQQQLALLELDDSRESAAKQAKLKEEIADLSNDLADDQADHAYDATSDMLDDMFDAYEKEKKKEIEVLENSISSEEKLYQLAIERIQTQWDTLYQQLLDWNYEYGTVTNNEITAAWDAACIAVEKYGSYLNAVLQTQQQLAALEASSSSSSSSTIIGGGLTGTSTTPNVIGNSGNYDTSGGQETENVHNIIKKMYANSRAWGNASESERKRLDAENLQLGQSLARYGINAYRDNGTWYTSDGSLLYEKYKKYTYHTGGIVGDDPTLEQDELFAKLKKGEAVFTKEQQKPIYQALDFAETMLGKYGKVINSISDTDLMGSRMQEQIKQDAQQTQTVVENSGMSNEFNLTFPMQVLQKLDDAEIKSLTKKISNYTIKELDSVFTMRGKRSLRY